MPICHTDAYMTFGVSLYTLHHKKHTIHCKDQKANTSLHYLRAGRALDTVIKTVEQITHWIWLSESPIVFTRFFLIPPDLIRNPGYKPAGWHAGSPQKSRSGY